MQELPEDRRNKTIRFTEEGLRETEHIMRKVRESERQAAKAVSLSGFCTTKRLEIR